MNIIKNIALITLLFVPSSVYSWGFFGHKQITEWAFYSLPDTLFDQLYTSQQKIIDYSITPDILKNTNPEEFCKHYIDLEYYSLDSIWKIDWQNCLNREECYIKGIVPYSVLQTYYRLVWAFRNNDKNEIIKSMGFLSHYASDLCTPLHTTKHYDGKENKFEGIHALWESYLPEQHFIFYKIEPFYPKIIPSLKNRISEELQIANKQVDIIYQSAEEIEQKIPNNVYGSFVRKSTIVEGFSKEFQKLFHRKMGSNIEDQMNRSVQFISQLWVSAYFESQKPNKIKEYTPIQSVKITRKTIHKHHE
jgi:hypothetical protein